MTTIRRRRPVFELFISLVRARVARGCVVRQAPPTPTRATRTCCLQISRRLSSATFLRNTTRTAMLWRTRGSQALRQAPHWRGKSCSMTCPRAALWRVPRAVDSGADTVRVRERERGQGRGEGWDTGEEVAQGVGLEAGGRSAPRAYGRSLVRGRQQRQLILQRCIFHSRKKLCSQCSTPVEIGRCHLGSLTERALQRQRVPR